MTGKLEVTNASEPSDLLNDLTKPEIPYNADAVPLGLRCPRVVGVLSRQLRRDGQNGELGGVVVPRLNVMTGALEARPLRVCADEADEMTMEGGASTRMGVSWLLVAIVESVRERLAGLTMIW